MRKSILKLIGTVFLIVTSVTCLLFCAGAKDNDYRTHTVYCDYDDDEYIIIEHRYNYEFTGSVIVPEVKVTLYNEVTEKETVLTEGEDYYVNSDNSVYPGDDCEFNVYSYSYELDEDYYFKIYYDESKLSVAPIEDCVYTGERPDFEVKVLYNDSVEIDRDEYYVECEYPDSDSWYSDYNVGKVDVYIEIGRDINLTASFNIIPAPAEEVTVEAVEDVGYTGSGVKPYLTVRYNGYRLENGEDYSVKYSNNKNIGTGTAKLTFKGNFKGTKNVSFNIVVGAPEYAYGRNYSKENALYWDCYGKYTAFRVYRYDTESKKYVLLKQTKYEYYDDTVDSQFTTYKYRIRTVLTLDGTNYFSKYVYVTLKTGLFAPTVTLTTKKGSITAKWTKNTAATSYILYRYNYDTGKTKKLLTTTDNKTLTYKDTSVTDYTDYRYYVVAVKKTDTGTVKSDDSTGAYSMSIDSITRGAKLTSKTSYDEYDVQGSKTKFVRTITLSKADINTLKKFAKAHFTSKMTPAEKVEITLNWIHNNVTYASSSANWNKISGKTFVDAIFNYKLGQCAQYNGALAGMMTYLGYNVKLIKGYRWYNSQHYWCECTINGLTYVMETGNKKDGSWHYYFQPYKNTSGYTKNGKMVSGINYRT